MSLIFLCLAIAVLWINLLGAGLAAARFVGDYALARVTGVIGICLVCFCLEHSVGWGPRLPILPVTTVVSIWLIWRNRDLLRRNWRIEALFGAGFFYCFAWRYTFPDIDFTEDKMPNFALIEAYMRGTRLPPPDLWLAPFCSNTYYSFQHYGAALLGRLLGVGPGVSYHLAFCTLVGFLTLLSGSCFARLCPWPLGRWVGVLSLVIGGSGVAVAAHALVKDPYPIDIVRFLGGAIVRDDADSARPPRLVVDGEARIGAAGPSHGAAQLFPDQGGLSSAARRLRSAGVGGGVDSRPGDGRVWNGAERQPRAARSHDSYRAHLERMDPAAAVPSGRRMVCVPRHSRRKGLPASRHWPARPSRSASSTPTSWSSPSRRSAATSLSA